MKIGVIGSGYVGLVAAACFAEMGNHVVCVDIDKHKIIQLKKGIVPIYEPGLEELVKKNYKSGRLVFISDLKEAVSKSNIIFICVGTPTKKNSYGADLNQIYSVAKEISSSKKGKILPVACDVRNIDEVNNVIKKSFDEFGKVNCLVNNAAGNFISPTERLSTRAFDAIIDIVLKGTINFTLILGKKWIKEKIDANVLNIITTYAWTGSGYVVPSACAKAGVLSMTRSLAVEWAKYNIRLNAIAPGPFPTKGAWERLLPGDLKEKFDPAKKVPVGRVGEHHELSNLAAYLVSDFSSYINGEVITIDGGEWLKGAGQFNNLELVTPEMWDFFEMMRKK